ncbi:hypothetical protein GYA25_01835 [Candidatus Woesearchaeota archaeon]|jgi:hypothetical protein|nr:hypothetical protein [Candidatus Woesearchaeota archaeon]
MALTSILITLIALVVLVLILFEVKKTKHKVLLILVLGFILFGYFSFVMVFKNKPISIKNLSDVDNLLNLYFSWLGQVFNNIKIITGQITKMDWSSNNSIKNITKNFI